MGAALLWLLRGKSGPGWCVLLLVYPLTQWLEQPLVQAVRGCRLSVMEAFGRISSSTLPALSRCSHLEIWTLLLCPRIFQLVLVYGCRLWSTAYWIFREILRALHLVRQWIHVLREALEEFTHFLRCGELESRGVWPPFLHNGEACTVDASGCSFSQRGSHFGG